MLVVVVFISVLVWSSFADNLTAVTSTTNHTSTTVISEVPLEFPKYSQNYTFVDNSSIRANLASRSENDTEVDDLLGKDTTKETSNTPSTIQLPNFPPNPSEDDEDIRNKNATEWLENGENTEDGKFKSETKGGNSTNTNSSRDGYVPLFDGHVAAILAVAFLVVSIFAYIGLLMWRRFLEMKYGSREMLVNDDEFIDPDDLKHFSI